MLEVTKSKAKKLLDAIPKKQIGVCLAINPNKSIVKIITKNGKQVIRICDGKFYA
jgi:hypothetical protein